MSGSASSGGPFKDSVSPDDSFDSTYPGRGREDGDHARALNYGVKWFLENYENHGYDIVIKEADYVNTPVSSPGSDDMWENIGDVDLGFIDLDNMDLRVYQIKQDSYYRVAGEGQNGDLSESFSNCSERLDDFSWYMVATVKLAKSVPEEEEFPPFFRGGNIYGPEEALEKARESENYRLLNRHVFDGNIDPTDENLLEPGSPATMEDILSG